MNDVDKSYDTEALPYAYTGTTLDNSGLVSASLNGLTNEEIGEMAIEKGAELDKNTNTLDGDVNSSVNTETKEFALNFTTAVQETEDAAKNVTTDDRLGPEVVSPGNKGFASVIGLAALIAVAGVIIAFITLKY